MNSVDNTKKNTLTVVNPPTEAELQLVRAERRVSVARAGSSRITCSH